MSLVIADRVKETTSTTGTGTITLAGAVSGFQSFATAVANTNTCFYCLLGGNTTDWETGYGTISTSGSNTLARTVIIASSNSNAAISLTGTSTVFLDTPAAHIDMASRPALALAKANAAFGNFANLLANGLIPTKANTGLTTWMNQGSTTEADNANGMYFSFPSQSSSSTVSCLNATAPGTPYSIIASWINGSQTTSQNGSILFGFSDGTKIVGMLVYAAWANSGNQALFAEWSAANNASPTVVGSTVTYFNYGRVYAKIKDDGTSIYFYLSHDGVQWTQVYTQTRTFFLSSPSKVVFGADSFNSVNQCTLDVWLQGTS